MVIFDFLKNDHYYRTSKHSQILGAHVRYDGPFEFLKRTYRLLINSKRMALNKEPAVHLSIPKYWGHMYGFICN